MDEPNKVPMINSSPTGLWGMKGRLVFIVIFTLIHLMLTVLLFLWSFSVVMGKMDNGDRFSNGEELIITISDIFLWPVFIPIGQVDAYRQILPAWSAVFILLLNSIVWGLVALALILGFQKIRHKQEKL